MARVALVTGGTRGIGAAISRALKASGYKVAASYAGNDAAARWVVVIYLAGLLRRELGVRLIPLVTPTRDDLDAARRGLRSLGIRI